MRIICAPVCDEHLGQKITAVRSKFWRSVWCRCTQLMICNTVLL